MTQKVLLVIVAVAVVGGAALFMMRGSQSEGDSQAVAPSAQNSEQQAIAPTPNPATAIATGGSSGAVVDEFSAAMDAELNASASAIAELDAGDNASVSDIQAAGSNSNLYDPNSI